MSLGLEPSRWFSHLVLRFRYPESFALGFPRMGHGIVSRSKRLASVWQSHLENCRAAQRRWIQQISSKHNAPRLLVLGAGRLLDVDLEALSQTFPEIFLVDADPLCLSVWEARRSEMPHGSLQWEICDITGKISGWRNELEAKLTTSQLEDLPPFLKNISKTESAISPLKKICADFRPTAILDVNLLSQLPVMWRDVIERSLIARFGRRAVAAQEASWFEAHLPSGRELIRRHLSDLATSGADDVMILSDLEHLHYPIDLKIAKEYSVSWEEVDSGAESLRAGRWMIKRGGESSRPATEHGFELSDALYGINLDNQKMREILFPGWQTFADESWLWNICPPGAERNTPGIINRVGAFRFVRQQSATL